MKKQDKNVLKSNGLGELEKDLKEKQDALRSAKFDLASGKVKNLYFIKDTRKTIARIKTFINQLRTK